MMTDQDSNLCTPVKEIEALKVALNKETDDEIEEQSEVTKRDEVRRSVRARIPTEKKLAYQRE